MNESSQDAVLRADRPQLRAALADLKRLTRRRRPPPQMDAPAEPLFKFVPASFIEQIDWDAADRAPGPEEAAARAAAPEPEYEGVMERADFFLKEFDWQDEADGTESAPTPEALTDSRARASASGDSFGWEEPAPPASAAAPPPAPETEDAAPPTTDAMFNGFQWE